MWHYRAAFFLTLTRRSRGDSRTYETASNLALLLSHMAFMSEGFRSGAVSRSGGHVRRAGAPAKEEGAKYH